MTFEPHLIKKQQTRFTSMDRKILFLYSKDMTTRDIVASFQEIYGANIYPIVYLDCIHVKISRNKKVHTKAIFLALGVNLEGKKELLGMWIAENEGAKFWLNVLTLSCKIGA